MREELRPDSRRGPPGRLLQLGGMERAEGVSWLPIAGQYMNIDLTIIGRPAPQRGEMNLAIPRTADPGYSHAMGIPLKRGRVFDLQERLERADKAIVSSSLVHRYFPNEDPIGKYVSLWISAGRSLGLSVTYGKISTSCLSRQSMCQFQAAC